MAFWNNMGKHKDTGDTNPEETDKQATETIEKSEREKFSDRLRVDVRNPEDVEYRSGPEKKTDSGSDTDDVDANVNKDGPERTNTKPVKTEEEQEDVR